MKRRHEKQERKNKDSQEKMKNKIRNRENKAKRLLEEETSVLGKDIFS
jgi:hypothetical protein